MKLFTQITPSLTRSASDVSLSAGKSDPYMEAVTSGDMETAQKMVDDAAKAAGYVKVFRASRNGAPHLIPRKGYQLTFSTRKQVADSYGEVEQDTKAFYILDSEARDFPVDKNGWFSKFDFDDAVKSGLLYVARQGYDPGPLSSMKRDPEALYSYPSDIYGTIHPEDHVKLSDPVTYDDQKNPIPLSKRFDKSHFDIRY